jgi:hypothetical protein
MLRWTTYLLVAVAVAAGCAAQEAADYASSESMSDVAPDYSAGKMRRQEAGFAAEAAESSDRAYAQLAQAVPTGGATPVQPPGALAAAQASRPDRFLIRNGTISLEVEDVLEAAQQVTATVVGLGGYIANRVETLPAIGTRKITMQVRAPASQFEAAMEGIAAAGKVLNRAENSQEVTEEFLDTEARSRNLKQTEERLLSHLQQATQLEQILAIEQEITRVREQIERLDGRLRYLSSRVEFSTIEVALNERAGREPVVPAQTWSAGQEFSQALRSMVVLGQVVLTLVIWLVVWSPVWVPLAVIFELLRRRALRKPSETPQELPHPQ